LTQPGLTRRDLLRLGAAGALVLAGCGGQRTAGSGTGSTLLSSWDDASGAGQLGRGPGVPLIDRHDLAPSAPLGVRLATLAHVTDAHLLDEESPARVPFLDRLGPPFTSTFRPHEALTAQVLAGAVRSINALRPDAVIQGGDLVDNAQSNELKVALAALGGGRVDPNSGGPGYSGPQAASNADPFYYRPDLDAPRHPGMLQQAQHGFASPGLHAPWLPVLGDHDLLVQGVVPPDAEIRAIATGSRSVWALPSRLRIPSGASLGRAESPDGGIDPSLVRYLIAAARAAPSVRVPMDAGRRQVGAEMMLARLRSASGSGGSGPLLDYTFDVGDRLRVIVLDLVRRAGGSGGLVSAGQPRWLRRQLRRAGRRWVIVTSHQPITTAEGGDALLAVLDRSPQVVAALWGHTHRNSVVARRSPAGGYWLIGTASLIDYPQQARALRLFETVGGGVALQTWMLDHVGGGLGDISRELSYLDAQGGRPQGFIGGHLDRNVTLYKAPPRR
jgi:3',5'-cyclic AMP phosphodiesterase CpdA